MKPQESTHGMMQVSGGPNSQFRYTEARIYAGDPVFVLGSYSSHRFDAPDLDHLPPEPVPDGSFSPAPRTATSVDNEREDEEERSEHREARGIDAWVAADIDCHDTLTEKAATIAKAEIETGGRSQPLVISTTNKAAHLEMTTRGSHAAFAVALVPLAIAGLVLLARFG